MVYQVAGSRSDANSSSDRIFRFEVTGWHQNQAIDYRAYALRSSASVILNVPFSRLNQELQRIHRLGAKLVRIQAATVAQGQVEPPLGTEGIADEPS